MLAAISSSGPEGGSPEGCLTHVSVDVCPAKPFQIQDSVIPNSKVVLDPVGSFLSSRYVLTSKQSSHYFFTSGAVTCEWGSARLGIIVSEIFGVSMYNSLFSRVVSRRC